MGEKIEIRSDGTINVPDIRSFLTSREMAWGLISGRHRFRVFDVAVNKSYGGKRKVHWLEVYAGEKASSVTGSGSGGDDRDHSRTWGVVSKGL